MSLLAGDSKDKKEIAYMGLRHCSNCDSLSHFNLYEIKRGYKVLFSKILKFDKSHAFLCENCESGIEIENDRVTDIVEDFKHISSKEECHTIFSEIEVFMNNGTRINDSLEIQLNALNLLKDSLEFKYTDNHMNHVFNAYSRYLKNSSSK